MMMATALTAVPRPISSSGEKWASFPTPGDDEFYWVDLIGLAVHTREGLALGQVVGLIETGPHCVLRVQSADAAADEVLIPFVSAYVDKVDLVGRSLVVDWQPDF